MQTSSSRAPDMFPGRAGSRGGRLPEPAVPAPDPSAADHRFSDQELAHLLAALRARAADHPENPGLVACWPAVPQHRMAAACRILALRGHPVEPVPVSGWQAERVRNGWRYDARSEQARAHERWVNEGGSDADARRAAERNRPER